jgi:SAM-dependent methyltransferase
MGAQLMAMNFHQQSRLTEAAVAVSDRTINYSLHLLERDEHERAHIRRELSTIKRQWQIANCTVLEVGCGLAANLEIFRADNTVVGVEGLGDAVAQARLRGLDVRQGDLATELNLRSGSVDWVLCLDVLEHMVKPMKLMEEIYRVLREEGRIILNVPNHFDLTGRLKILAGHNLDVHNFFPESDEWNNPHVRFFTHNGITRLVKEVGFKILDDRSAHFYSFPKSSLLERVGLRPLLRFLAQARSTLFAGGFFLIAQKCAPTRTHAGAKFS